MSRKYVLAGGWLLLLGLSASLPLAALFHGIVKVGTGTIVMQKAPVQPVVAFGSTVRLLHGAHAVMVGVGGDVRVTGRVTDDVIALGGSVYLERGADVRGDVLSMVGGIYKAPGSRVEGRIGGALHRWNGISVHRRDVWRTIGNSMRLGLAAGLALLLVGTCLTVVFPWQVILISTTLRSSPAKSAGAGLASLIAFVFLVVPLGLSLAGLPFALLLSGAASLAWLFGLTAFSMLVGRTLARRTVPLLWAAAAGLIALALVMAVPVIGPLAVSLAGLTGAGALAVALVGRARPATPAL